MYLIAPRTLKKVSAQRVTDMYVRAWVKWRAWGF